MKQGAIEPNVHEPDVKLIGRFGPIASVCGGDGEAALAAGRVAQDAGDKGSPAMSPGLLQALLGLPDVGGPLPVCSPDFPAARDWCPVFDPTDSGLRGLVPSVLDQFPWDAGGVLLPSWDTVKSWKAWLLQVRVVRMVLRPGGGVL